MLQTAFVRVLVLSVLLAVKGDNPDTFLEVPDLIVYNGYPQETHKVLTEDGYALAVHRIPEGREGGNSTNNDKPVVLLQHGLFGSSSNWVFAGVGNSLAYMLADVGYDVWMCNARGNTYSTLYTPKRDPSTRGFWNFSWHEGGVYDIPATIDYILEKTGKKKIVYVGHSMGTTMFYVMASQRPEYNDKVAVMVSLAPVAYMAHIKIGVLDILARLSKEIAAILNVVGINELKPIPKILKNVGEILCFKTPFLKNVCKTLMSIIVGKEYRSVNKNIIPVLINNFFAGSSTKQVIHYAQLITSGFFRQYDFGLLENLARYRDFFPPKYNISKITTPIALFYGDSDQLADVRDVENLHEELPNVIKFHKVPFEGFTHEDFVIHKSISSLINKPVIDICRNYTEQ